MNQTIGVFFGSRSPEHDVSIVTGEFVMRRLRDLNYRVVPVYIGKDGQWYIQEQLGKLKFFTNDASFSEQLAGSGWNRFYLDLEASRGKLAFCTKGWRKRTVEIDLVFPTVHGSGGEDGTLQGLCEMFQAPYVGCEVAASAVAMDKVLTKLILQGAGIPTAKFIFFTKAEFNRERAAILARLRRELNYPVIVKPARLGSSIGVAKIADPDTDALATSIEVALQYDHKVLIEQAIEPVADLTVCVLGTEPVRLSLIQQSVFSRAVLDFTAKYLEEGGTQLGGKDTSVVIPAPLSPEVTEAISEVARKIFRLLGCSGIARVDFLYNQKTGEWFANEVNTLPGTLYHHLWERSGVPFDEVLQTLIKLAAERALERRRLVYSFPSQLLTAAGSLKLAGNKLGL
ncbi:MAG: D-alanine--D-alanine ligase [Candidatus Magasanikbacteria bacterium]|nr:D-alanine--D-alanine ligase [Candidatus Magasanikbacteria bacterium]